MGRAAGPSRRLAGGAIGLSNVSREELDRALAVADIASVQNRFNREDGDEEGLVDYTAGKGIAEYRKDKGRSVPASRRRGGAAAP